MSLSLPLSLSLSLKKPSFSPGKIIFRIRANINIVGVRLILNLQNPLNVSDSGVEEGGKGKGK